MQTPTATVQIVPLAVTSGNSEINRKMRDQNTRIAEMLAQAKEDSKFDPPPAQPLTEPKIVYEGFIGGMKGSLLIPALLGGAGLTMLLWKRK